MGTTQKTEAKGSLIGYDRSVNRSLDKFSPLALETSKFVSLTQPRSIPKLQPSPMLDHPNDAELKRYCEGTGPADFMATIDDHVGECGDCGRRVVEIVRESIRSAQAHVDPRTG